MRFSGKVLLATGAGSGIAAAVAETFVAEGGSVALLDWNHAAAAAVASRLDRSLAIDCDVASESAVRQAVDHAVQTFGRIDCVLNSAGHVINKPIDDVSLDDWNRMMAVHVTGTFLVCKHAVPHLKRGDTSSIVNMSSVAAVSGIRNLSAYSAAKGAILALSRQLAMELAPHRIRVNTVVPGSIETPMSIALAVDRGGGDRARGIQPVIDNTPLGRVGTPAEAAAAILFLLSDAASYFTGSDLRPDGGLTAR